MKLKSHKFDAIFLGNNEPPAEPVMVGNQKTGEFKAPVFEGFYAIDYKTTILHRKDLLCYPMKLLPEKDPETLSYTQRRRLNLSGKNNRFPKDASSYPLIHVCMEYAKQTNPIMVNEDYRNLSTGEILHKAWRQHALTNMTAEAAVYRRWIPQYSEELANSRAVWIQKKYTDAIGVGDYISFDFDLGMRVKYGRFFTMVDPICGLTVGPNTKYSGLSVGAYASVMAAQRWSFDSFYCYSLKKPGQPGYRVGMPTNELLSAPYPLP